MFACMNSLGARASVYLSRAVGCREPTYQDLYLLPFMTKCTSLPPKSSLYRTVVQMVELC